MKISIQFIDIIFPTAPIKSKEYGNMRKFFDIFIFSIRAGGILENKLEFEKVMASINDY